MTLTRDSRKMLGISAIFLLCLTLEYSRRLGVEAAASKEDDIFSASLGLEDW
jgi:hypothetical protein